MESASCREWYELNHNALDKPYERRDMTSEKIHGAGVHETDHR